MRQSRRTFIYTLVGGGVAFWLPQQTLTGVKTIFIPSVTRVESVYSRWAGVAIFKHTSDSCSYWDDLLIRRDKSIIPHPTREQMEEAIHCC